MTRLRTTLFSLLLAGLVTAETPSSYFTEDDELGANLEAHPDPNDEHYDDMIYVGRHHHHNGRRISLNEGPNSIRYIFGTGFDPSHKDIEEKDLEHEHDGAWHDLANREHRLQHETRAEQLRERRHGDIGDGQPKPFGHVDVHELDGGVTPVKVVEVEPFFLDIAPVTNKQFAKFVKSTYYETEAEHFGWSFVLASFLGELPEDLEVDPEAEHWVAVEGAYWRQPEGPQSSYKYREHHPVVHVSHRDAAEYCKWVGKRLPGEREWEAAARAGHYGPSNRTLFTWGDDDTVATAAKHANLWGAGAFPFENHAEDGWRGTSPVKTFPPNRLGFYDMTGNVWEWMRGGKHQARIVRGGSHVDTTDGSHNHAATLGARSTLHATTTTGNVGFRCAKSPSKRTEYHWKWHDEAEEGQLAIEDKFGKRDYVPKRGWEDILDPDVLDEDHYDEELGKVLKRKKVIKKVERLSTEL